MGYIEKNLISGEKVLYKTRLHSIAVVFPLLVALLMGIGAVCCLYVSMAGNQQPSEDSKLWAASGLVLLFVAVLTMAIALLKRNATEMAVTNRRVLIKSGILSRRTIELLLSKVESIVIKESFFGRMLGYGTVLVRGTGGTTDDFHLIANPTDFRRHVQEQIEAGQVQSRPAGNVTS
jgi:uncharacterized membrane protein YdbT with pleckstrin-like domain